MARLLYHTDYALVVRLETRDGDTVPPVVRLRSALKAMLRSHGLRVRHIEEVPAPPPGVAQGERGTAGATGRPVDSLRSSDAILDAPGGPPR